MQQGNQMAQTKAQNQMNAPHQVAQQQQGWLGQMDQSKNNAANMWSQGTQMQQALANSQANMYGQQGNALGSMGSAFGNAQAGMNQFNSELLSGAEQYGVGMQDRDAQQQLGWQRDDQLRDINWADRDQTIADARKFGLDQQQLGFDRQDYLNNEQQRWNLEEQRLGMTDRETQYQNEQGSKNSDGLWKGVGNLADAICFVLGRLKVKSLRANKAAKLIYHGGKEGKPAQFAKVSMVFDNSDNIFVLPEPSNEVEITRIVKKDGTSTYKINGKTKTRQEILELLAQAGIDPEGFNIILQAEISTIIKMHPNEKREIIEEIAGINIYEARKERSLKELDKTENKLKEIKITLKERAAYMNNLEKEKAQAEKYKNLNRMIRRDKAALVFKKIKEKEDEKKKLEKRIVDKKEYLSKIQNKINNIQRKIINFNKQIQDIDEHINKKSGVEQEKLYTELSELRSNIVVLRVKIENYKEQIKAIDKRVEQLNIEEIRKGQELKQYEQEKSREKEYKLNIHDFKAEIVKAAKQIKEESKKVEKIFNDLFEKIRQRKTRIDDLIRQNDIKGAHNEINALVYSLEESVPELSKISKKTSRIALDISKLQISEEEKRNINLDIELARKDIERIKDIIAQ